MMCVCLHVNISGEHIGVCMPEDEKAEGLYGCDGFISSSQTNITTCRMLTHSMMVFFSHTLKMPSGAL